MFIKRLKPNVYDVFVGNGWAGWARVLRARDGIRQIAGKFRLNQEVLDYVKGRVSR